ncbi:MAG: putative TetR family transcriptional regulator [Chloroflexi bacterium]|nr:putative TetR family transcriptional regulator [Chloroflexota bacterium]
MNEESLPRGERTRAEILQAASQLFIEKGYHGTSMRAIASQAGIALGNIYNHFPNKEELFIQVLLVRHPFYEVLPAIVAARGETTEEFVRDAAQRMVAQFDERLEFLNLLFIELVEFKGEHIPQIFQMLFPQVLAFAERFTQGRQELRPLPLPIIVRAFIGLFFSYALTELIINRNLPPEMQEDAMDDFVTIYLHGILVK